MTVLQLSLALAHLLLKHRDRCPPLPVVAPLLMLLLLQCPL